MVSKSTLHMRRDDSSSMVIESNSIGETKFRPRGSTSGRLPFWQKKHKKLRSTFFGDNAAEWKKAIERHEPARADKH